MDAISLLFCKSATSRHSEPMSWLCIALVAIVAVVANAGAELIFLWLGFTVGLCLRARAAVAAHRIRRAVLQASYYVTKGIDESKVIRLRNIATTYFATVIALRRVFAALQASLARLGLPHVCLSPKVLPQPISAARH